MAFYFILQEQKRSNWNIWRNYIVLINILVFSVLLIYLHLNKGLKTEHYERTGTEFL